MRLLTICLVLAAMGASTGALLQGRTLRAAKFERESLRAEKREAALPDDTSARQEREKLKEETRGLLQLRNQVRQLRLEARELPKLRSENKRLVEAQQAGLQVSAQDAATAEGFISREALADLGLATPEAAVQTFFRAMRDGDVHRFIECLPPDSPDRQHFQKITPELLPKVAAEWTKPMETFTNYRVVERQDLAPDKVILRLQSSSGSQMNLTLRLVSAEWHVEF